MASKDFKITAAELNVPFEDKATELVELTDEEMSLATGGWGGGDGYGAYGYGGWGGWGDWGGGDGYGAYGYGGWDG